MFQHYINRTNGSGNRLTPSVERGLRWRTAPGA